MVIALAERVSKIKPSPTMSVNAKANELRARGEKIINLSVGEPDFDTPDFVKEAATQAIQKGFTKYTDVDGIKPLKEAIIQKLKTDNNLSYALDEVMVTSGVKQGIYNLAQAVLNEGDEVIIPAPYWVSYPDIIKLAGATPVFIETGIQQHFKITAQDLAAKLTEKTRLIFLNSPSNPTGIAYNATELKALGDVLKKYPNVLIATDDIYEYILWGLDRFVNILNVCPELFDQTVVFNGVSKSHAMTGWRIGYAAGPKSVIAAMKKIQSQSTSCADSIAQLASVAALNHDRSFFEPMLKAYKERHDYLLERLNRLPGVNCVAADGAFYLFPHVAELNARLQLKDDLALSEWLLEKAKIAVVPGTAFGAPNYIRISYATSLENLQQAMDRLEELLRNF